MRVESWLKAAIADADERGLPQLKPVLEAIARSTAALRRQAGRSPESGDDAIDR